MDTQRPGGTDSLKNLQSKSRGIVPLNCLQAMQCFILLNPWIEATITVALIKPFFQRRNAEKKNSLYGAKIYFSKTIQ
jgi:hypothetical protein